MGGLVEAQYPTPDEEGPVVQGRLTRKRIPRTNDYTQAGERFRLMMDWERDDLVKNLVANISQATNEVQRRMVRHFYMCEDELGQRVGGGLGISVDEVRNLEPRDVEGASDDPLRAQRTPRRGCWPPLTVTMTASFSVPT
jgi:catalase